ncbi:Folylpolyglutamate synthase [subsurface metagenome]
MTVFMAFEYFAYQEVDIAIIEVGLGGRLDTTNIITPEVSVITNIGKDHTLFLGNTLREIAGEKAGIIKNKIPVVIGETQNEIDAVFKDIARLNESNLYFADQYYSVEYQLKNPDNSIALSFSKCFYWDFKKLNTDLLGNYQQSNIITSLMTLATIDKRGIKIKEEGIENGLRQVKTLTGIVGRWQEISYNPLVICDIAHNKEGFEKIITQISDTPHQKLHMVLGFVSDKDVGAILDILPNEAIYYLCEPDIPRAMKSEELELLFQQHNLECVVCKEVSEAYSAASEHASVNDLIYIGGSTFVVADFLAWNKQINS